MNFRSQKGATGADIMIAITVIVLSVAVVSMIYVNTTLQSRNVTRTAGATRIAINVLENIEKLTYVDFLAEYGNPSKWTDVTSGTYNGYKTATNTTVFSTKIPKGYTVYLKAEPNYGSYSADDSNRDKRFDLVRAIEISVNFKVGDMERVVDFSSSKTREITDEVNPPDTTVLASQNITNSTSKFYPIKYSLDANAYIQTTEGDPEWYSYSNKRWAMVIVSGKNENELFDVNGKLTTTDSGDKKYVWVPKFFYSESGGTKKITEFAYLSSSDKAIKEKETLTAVDGSTTLFYNALGPKKTESQEPSYFVLSGNQKVSGKWIFVNNINSQEETKILNSSQYGPCELH